MPPFLTAAITVAAAAYFVRQCRKPTGPLGSLVVRLMNRSHSSLTDWGLGHTSIAENETVLDLGCGGGQTIRKLAAIASSGKVYGVDYSAASVTASRRLNRTGVAAGRIEVYHATVSHLPLGDATVDLATAVETFYYWPDRVAALREIRRVLKPGGRLLIISEMYRDGIRDRQNTMAMKLVGGDCLGAQEHREIFQRADYVDIQVFTHSGHGWLCIAGNKPE